MRGRMENAMSLGLLLAGENAGHGLRVAHPRRRLLLEVRLPPGSHLVVARAAAVLRDPPLGRNELAPLEAVEPLVERAIVHVERAARALLEPAGNLEPVHGLPRERAQDQQVERALHQ